MSDLLKEDLGGLLQENNDAVLTESDVQLDFVAQSNRTDQISTKTWAHTVGDELDRVLVVLVTYNANNDTEAITSVTYGGVALSSLPMVGAGSGGLNRRVQLWYLNDPATGTADVQVAFSANTVTFLGTSISLAGAADIDPAEAFSASTTSANTLSQTPATVPGSVVLSAAAVRDSGAAVAPSPLWNLVFSGSNNRSAGGAIATTGTSTPVTYSWATGGNGAMQGIEILPAAPGMVRTATQSAAARIITLPKMASLVDNFSDSTQNNGLGNWQKPGGGALPAGMQITGGRLVGQASTTYESQVESRLTYDLRESGAQVRVIQRPTQGGGGSTEAYFGVRLDDDNAYLAILTGSGSLVFELVSGGTVAASGFVTYDPTAMAYLRWEEHLGIVSFLTGFSATGPWTQQFSFSGTDFDLKAMRAFFMAGDYGSTPDPGQAIWDNFNVTGQEETTGTSQLIATARIAQTRSQAQPAASRISRTLTRSQPAAARVARTLPRTQPAVARVAQTRTSTQSALARVARTLSRTQTATARIAQTRTALQSAVARISAGRTRSQSAAARIAITGTRTQSALARIATSPTRLQTATARIARTFTRSQPGTARLAQTRSVTQSGTAYIIQTTETTQTAAARIAATRTWTQPAAARIAATRATTQGAVSRIAQTLTAAQSAVARVAQIRTHTQLSAGRLSLTRSRAQITGSRIAVVRTAAQSAIARIAAVRSATQSATARVSRTGTTPQTGTARVAVTRSAIQPAVARIEASSTIAQPAVARIAAGLSWDHPATARIATTSTTSQPAAATIAQSYTSAQSAIARVATSPSADQPAVAAIAATFTATQTGTARVVFQDPGGTWDTDDIEPTQWDVLTRESTGFATTIEVTNPVEVTITQLDVDDDVSADTITPEVDHP